MLWAKDHNIRFYLTPTNGSWLNRIESQFTALRKFALQPSDYPRWQKLHIVMDNYGPHITDQVRAWAKDHNIRFYLTPTNGSWLNRIESQFTALRKFALQPSDYR